MKLRILMVASTLVALLSANGAAALSPTNRNASINDQMLVAQAIARHENTIEYQLLCDPADSDQIASDLQRLQIRVVYDAPEIGYFHVVLPLAKIETVARLSELQKMDVLPAEGNPKFDSIEMPKPQRSTPYDTPLTAPHDVRADAFMHAHPTFDGRGVTIGFVELFDPTHPALRLARALDGTSMPKVVDYRVCCASDYKTNSTVGWVDVHRVVARSRHVPYAGRSFATPYDGTFSVGIFQAKGYASTNSSRVKTLGALSFPVLWDERTGVVFVDTAQSGSFVHAVAMRPYRFHQDVGFFPMRRPAQPGEWPKGVTQPSNVPFVLQTEPSLRKIAFIIPVNESHGTMTTTSAAGQGFFNGAAGGIAPNARIASVGPLGDWVEGMIELARMHVDIISLSGGQFAPGYLHDAIDRDIISRLIARYHVIVVSAAQNEGFMETTDTPENDAEGSIVIGGYASKRLLGATIGVEVPHHDYVVHYSSAGPRYDGMLRPDVVSPTGWVAGTSRFLPPEYIYGDQLLPRGYEVGGGTSQAAPTAAGAVALLVSAAKQMHVPYSAQLLRRALDSGARSIDGIATYRQGDGVIDVPGAWKRLRNPPRDLSSITFSAPLETADAGKSWEPSKTGEGLFLREGWSAGMRGPRTIDITRHDGPAGIARYAVRLVGNDGTFAANVSSLDLPLGAPVPLTLAVAPRTGGAHSAILRIVNEDTGELVGATMLVVVAAAQFSAQNGYHVSVSSAVTQPDSYSYFIHVPPNTDAVTLRLRLPPGADPETLRNFAAQWNLLTTTLPNGEEPRGGWPQFMVFHNGNMWEHTFWRPMAGVWEVQFDSARIGFWLPHVGQKLSPIPFTISASIYRVATASARADGGRALHVSLYNAGAPFQARSIVIRNATVSHGDARITGSRMEMPFTVPATADEVRVRIRDVSPAIGDVAIHMFNCVTKQIHFTYGQTGVCTLAAESDPYRGDRLATTAIAVGGFGEVPRPPVPGPWVIVFTRPSATGGDLTVHYEIEIIDRAQRKMTLPAGTHGSGGTWEQTAALPAGSCAGTRNAVLAQIQSDDVATIIRSTPFPPERYGPPPIVTAELPTTKPRWVYPPVWEALVPLSCSR